MTCQPKGSMCMGCSNGSAACGQLDFGSMPVIQVYPDGVKAVKCSGHRAVKPPPPRRCIHCHAEAPTHLEEGESPPCDCQ